MQRYKIGVIIRLGRGGQEGRGRERRGGERRESTHTTIVRVSLFLL